jgi:hypothetical protein
MPRSLTPGQSQKRAASRRKGALAHLDLRQPSSPRTAAAGPTSHAVKTVDPEAAAAIEAFLAKRRGLLVDDSPDEGLQMPNGPPGVIGGPL